MHHVLTVEQMRAADATAINEYNIAGVLLMENAARSTAEYIEHIFREIDLEFPMIDIICGSGNNGGDGFALARHLHENYPVRVFWIGQQGKMSPETKNNFLSAEKLDIEMHHIETDEDLKFVEFSNDCVIDSMIGVGGSENIKGIALEILKKVKNNPALKIAVDAPTGLNTVSGIAGENCFKADSTITMFAVKTGMLLNDGPDVCGFIYTAYLGAPEQIVKRHYKICRRH